MLLTFAVLIPSLLIGALIFYVISKALTPAKNYSAVDDERTDYSTVLSWLAHVLFVSGLVISMAYLLIFYSPDIMPEPIRVTQTNQNNNQIALTSETIEQLTSSNINKVSLMEASYYPFCFDIINHIHLIKKLGNLQRKRHESGV